VKYQNLYKRRRQPEQILLLLSIHATCFGIKAFKNIILNIKIRFIDKCKITKLYSYKQLSIIRSLSFISSYMFRLVYRAIFRL